LRRSRNRSLAKKKAWRYFSEYTRRRYADPSGFVRCITCNKTHHWKEVDAGHFASRRYEATLFDEKNVHPQCVSCNKYHSGRQFEFGLFIDKTYGEGTAGRLMLKSKTLCKRQQLDYELIAQEYYDKLKQLDDTKT